MPKRKGARGKGRGRGGKLNTSKELNESKSSDKSEIGDKDDSIKTKNKEVDSVSDVENEVKAEFICGENEEEKTMGECEGMKEEQNTSGVTVDSEVVGENEEVKEEQNTSGVTVDSEAVGENEEVKEEQNTSGVTVDSEVMGENEEIIEEQSTSGATVDSEVMGENEEIKEEQNTSGVKEEREVASKSFDEEDITLTAVEEKSENDEINLSQPDPIETPNEIEEKDNNQEMVHCDETEKAEDEKAENVGDVDYEVADERYEDVEEEVFIDKEEDDDIQYIDEEIDEGEQDLLDVIELADDNENDNRNRKEKTVVQEVKAFTRKSLNSSKEEIKPKEDEEREDIGNTTFEEISEGSMDPMEQEEVIEAISDNEMIIEVSSQDPEEEKISISKKKKRSSSFHEDETLADIFQVTENDGNQKVKDKDNDDISDASLCDDDIDNDGNLSLEEISDEEFESSKRRKSDGCAEPPPLDDQNKDTGIDDGVENISDVKPESPVGDVENEDTKKRPNDDVDNDDVDRESNSAKRQKLSQDRDGVEQSQDVVVVAAEKITCVTVQTEEDKTQIPLSSPHSVGEEIKCYQKPSTSVSRRADASAQTQPLSRRGKIVQCTINRVGGSALGAITKQDPEARMKDKISVIFEKYKSHLPSSVEDVFTDVASTNSPDKGTYSLSLGPVTMADFGNSQFRDICLSSAEKFNLSFDSKMQGLLHAQFSKQVEVSKLIHNLKGLDLGIRYMIMSLVHKTCQDDCSERWQALLIFTYNQDTSPMASWDAKDGKVRSKLSISGVPEGISKDFVHLVFPEALYISTCVGKENGRALTMGFSSTRLSREISSCYELLLFNGEKVEITSLDPALSECQVDAESGFTEEDGTVIVEDVEEIEIDNNPPSTLQDKAEETSSSHPDETSQTDPTQNMPDDGISGENRKESKEEGCSEDVNMEEQSLETAKGSCGVGEEKDGGSESCGMVDESKNENAAKDSESGEKSREEKSEKIEISEKEAKDVEIEEVDTTVSDINDLAEEEKSLLEKEKVDSAETMDVSQSVDVKDGEEETELVTSQTDMPGGDNDVTSVSAEKSETTTPTVKAGCETVDSVDPCSELLEVIEDKSTESDLNKGSGDSTETGTILEGTVGTGPDLDEDGGKDGGGEKNSEKDEKHVEIESESVNDESGHGSNIESQEVVVQPSTAEDGEENSLEKSQAIEVENDGSADMNEKEEGKEKSGQDDEPSESKEMEDVGGGKDTNLEDVSDDDVIILKEVPPQQIVANIDLTLEESFAADKDQDESKCEAELKEHVKEEEILEDDDKLTMTDGDLEVVLESIDVEEQEMEYESVLYLRSGDYRGKYYNSNFKDGLNRYNKPTYYGDNYAQRHHQTNMRPHARDPPPRREPPKRKPSPDFSYKRVYGRSETEARNENQRQYEKLSSIHSGSSLDDKYSETVTRPRLGPSRDQASLRRDGPKRDYRRSKSPSPRREMTLDHPGSRRDMTVDHPNSRRDTTFDHPASRREITSDHPGSRREMTSDHTASRRDMTSDHPASRREITSDHPAPRREMTSDHPNSRREMTSDHPASRREMTSDHPASRREMTSDHPAPRREMTSDHPAPRREMTSDHPASRREMTSDHPAPRREMTSDHPASRREMTSDHPASRREMTSDHPPSRREMTSDHPAPRREMTSDHPASRREMTSDHPAPRREMTSDHPSSRREMTSDHPASRREMTSDHPAPRREMTSDHPAPRREMTSDHPAPRREMISDHPASRREMTSDHPANSSQHSMPAFSSSANSKQAYNYSNAQRPRTSSYRDKGPADSSTRQSHHQSYYDLKNTRTDGYPSRSNLTSKYEATGGRREEYRSQKTPAQRSKSRSYSPLSPMSVSSNELIMRTSPHKSKTAARKISHSPISASSRSLSPVSKSPSPPTRHNRSSKYKPSPPKAYRDRYSPLSRDDSPERIPSRPRRSRSPSYNNRWERRRSRSPHYRRRRATPSPDRERAQDKKTQAVCAFRTTKPYRSESNTNKSYDNKIKTMYDNKNSIYKNSSSSTLGSKQQTDSGKSKNQSTVNYGAPSSSTAAVNFNVPQPISTTLPPPNYAAPSNYLQPAPQPMFYSNSSFPAPSYPPYNVGMAAFPSYPGQLTPQMYSYMPTSPSMQPHPSTTNPYSPYPNAQAAMNSIPPSSSLPPGASMVNAAGVKRGDHHNMSSSKSNDSKKHWSMGDGASALMFQRILSKK